MSQFFKKDINLSSAMERTGALALFLHRCLTDPVSLQVSWELVVTDAHDQRDGSCWLCVGLLLSPDSVSQHKEPACNLLLRDPDVTTLFSITFLVSVEHKEPERWCSHPYMCQVPCRCW